MELDIGGWLMGIVALCFAGIALLGRFVVGPLLRAGRGAAGLGILLLVEVVVMLVVIAEGRSGWRPVFLVVYSGVPALLLGNIGLGLWFWVRQGSRLFGFFAIANLVLFFVVLVGVAYS